MFLLLPSFIDACVHTISSLNQIHHALYNASHMVYSISKVFSCLFKTRPNFHVILCSTITIHWDKYTVQGTKWSRCAHTLTGIRTERSARSSSSTKILLCIDIFII